MLVILLKNPSAIKDCASKSQKELLPLRLPLIFSSHWDMNLYDLELSFYDRGNQSFPFFSYNFLKNEPVALLVILDVEVAVLETRKERLKFFDSSLLS